MSIPLPQNMFFVLNSAHDFVSTVTAEKTVALVVMQSNMSAGFFCINGLFDSCPLCLSHIHFPQYVCSQFSFSASWHVSGLYYTPSSLASTLYTLYHRTSYLLSDTFSVAVSCLSFICFSLYFISNVFSSSPLSFHSFPIVPYSPFLSYFIPSPFPNFLFCLM